MSTETNRGPIRIHTHFGRIALSDADGYLSPIHAGALATELEAWIRHLAKGLHPATRLVYPDGRRVTETTNEPSWVFV